MNIDLLVRENIRQLRPYSSARDEFNGEASVFLDANENCLGDPEEKGMNRYPDPFQRKLKNALAKRLNVSPSQLFLGNGSDEAIDLLFRIFCDPGTDKVLLFPPTYGMYAVAASINGVEIVNLPLGPDFTFPEKDFSRMKDQRQLKLVFICSPNNPSGNCFPAEQILRVLDTFPGIVVVDEAYVHFSGQPSLTGLIEKYPNLVVLQTFSKAMGMAGIRLGIAVASRQVIRYFNAVKPPYNISTLTQKAALNALANETWTDNAVRIIITNRKLLAAALEQCKLVEKVYPSDANFLLVKVRDPKKIYASLLRAGVVVRDRSDVPLCEGCLRITIGTMEQNTILLNLLNTLTLTT
ncbi:MAG: histidinol-phosphate transaminase [Bacteroidia bacterium]|nr:histidinol-phosphate transaminase [Bacteroidia bacterium]